MSVNEYWRAPINHQNNDVTLSKCSHKVFQEDIDYLKNYFITYDVKGQVCHNARTYNSLLIPDPERSPPVHIRIICSQWMQVSHQLKVCNNWWKNIRTSLEIIHTGSEILIPDPKSSGRSNNLKNLFICIYSVAKLHLLNCVWRIRLWGGSEQLIDFIN